MAGTTWCSTPIFPSPKIGGFDSELVEEFWRAFSGNALCNLHVERRRGRNSHHIAEAIFMAAGRSLRMAVEHDPRMPGVCRARRVR